MKEEEILTECAYCIEELPVGDTYTCKTCGLDPLCGICITSHPYCSNPEVVDIA